MGPETRPWVRENTLTDVRVANSTALRYSAGGSDVVVGPELATVGPPLITTPSSPGRPVADEYGMGS